MCNQSETCRTYLEELVQPSAPAEDMKTGGSVSSGAPTPKLSVFSVLSDVFHLSVQLPLTLTVMADFWLWIHENDSVIKSKPSSRVFLQLCIFELCSSGIRRILNELNVALAGLEEVTFWQPLLVKVRVIYNLSLCLCSLCLSRLVGVNYPNESGQCPQENQIPFGTLALNWKSKCACWFFLNFIFPRLEKTHMQKVSSLSAHTRQSREPERCCHREMKSKRLDGAGAAPQEILNLRIKTLQSPVIQVSIKTHYHVLKELLAGWIRAIYCPSLPFVYIFRGELWSNCWRWFTVCSPWLEEVWAKHHFISLDISVSYISYDIKVWISPLLVPIVFLTSLVAVSVHPYLLSWRLVSMISHISSSYFWSSNEMVPL